MAEHPLTAPQIAHLMGLTRQAVQKQLNLLMKEGYVAQQANPLHERSHLYVTTGSGKDTFAKARALYFAWIDQIAAGISEQQCTKTRTILELATHNIEKTMKEIKKK